MATLWIFISIYGRGNFRRRRFNFCIAAWKTCFLPYGVKTFTGNLINAENTGTVFKPRFKKVKTSKFTPILLHAKSSHSSKTVSHVAKSYKCLTQSNLNVKFSRRNACFRGSYLEKSSMCSDFNAFLNKVNKLQLAWKSFNTIPLIHPKHFIQVGGRLVLVSLLVQVSISMRLMYTGNQFHIEHISKTDQSAFRHSCIFFIIIICEGP